MLAGAAFACASSTQPAVSHAVRELRGIDCPDDRVRVLETRDLDDDTLYVVDACGKKLELTEGYAIPERKSDVTEYSAESGLELPPGIRSSVPGDVTDIVRKKVQRWCRTVGRDADPDAIAFTADSLEQCRARLANGLTPLGTQPGEHGEPDIYWFAIGRYVFTARQSFSSAGAPEKHVVANTRPNPKYEPRIWYARLELGIGYLTTSRISTEGGSMHVRPQLGLKLNDYVAFGLVTAYHLGFADDFPLLYEIGVPVSYYPFAETGLRLEASVSAAWLRFAETEFTKGGPLYSVAISYDEGARRKNTTGSWSGVGLTVRGFYASLPGPDVASAALYLSWWSW